MLTTFRPTPGAPAFGWYLATDEDGTQYVIRQGEFSWYLQIGDTTTSHRTLAAAKAAAREQAGR